MFASADVARHALDLSKATFDNLYLTVSGLQHLAEDALLDTAGQARWMPQEVQSLLREWVGLAQRTRADLKETVDRSHGLLHGLIDRASPVPAGAPAPEDGVRVAVEVH